MPKRLRKFLSNGTHLVLLGMLLATIFGIFPGGFVAGCLTVNTAALLHLLIDFKRLRRTFYDRKSRVEFSLPIKIGIGLNLAVILAAGLTAVSLAALIFLLVWIQLWRVYRATQSKFPVVGDGLLPAEAWINPPPAALQKGDVLLMSGRISRMTGNSVGHTEVVLEREKNGKPTLVAFSSYIENGVVFHSLRALCKVQIAGKGHYIAMRPVAGFTDDQNARAVVAAQRLYDENKSWVERELPRRKAILNRWLPDRLVKAPLLRRFAPGLKRWIAIRYLPTGYDGISMYLGTHRPDRWTCQWVVFNLLREVDVPIDSYESGFLGLGTGFLNPPNPVGFIKDRAYRLLTVEDEQQFAQAGPVAEETA